MTTKKEARPVKLAPQTARRFAIVDEPCVWVEAADASEGAPGRESADNPARQSAPDDPWDRDLLAGYYEVFQHRHPDLFLRFLPEGYRMTTLSSVSPRARAATLGAKWRLG